MGKVLQHPTADQQALLATFKSMRKDFDDPIVEDAAAEVTNMLRISEAYWRRQVDVLWRVIYVLFFAVCFLIGWSLS